MLSNTQCNDIAQTKMYFFVDVDTEQRAAARCAAALELTEYLHLFSDFVIFEKANYDIIKNNGGDGSFGNTEHRTQKGAHFQAPCGT